MNSLFFFSNPILCLFNRLQGKFVSEESQFKGKTGLRRVWNALHYSMAGLSAAYANEDAFRQETLLAAILIALSFFLPVTWIGRALMIGSVFLVLIVELINSAIEAIVDRVSLDRHPLSKRAKDIGSAAVFLALLNVVVVWFCVLLDGFAVF
jgi:diacylglycerol kinase (ATP)